ncbi:MAG: flavodoxin-dependent (E)-4-hydroxy-3-methylbut-2-enyl-diphosphate synthase [Dehalococcoidales bacterium]|jgi:(E)-4-hydroxy-3-methylbut-2-enyl-diphosphate synthase|nr:flavodoxin-dependent (E)-4-hydroxy-3-methylbut-2-enyl-diphosphate synthase [Dehalococcoidales bacterium]
MLKRRPSKKIFIGNVAVGGDAPITVQSMTKTDTRDVRATVNQICELAEYGCEIIRVAVPDMEAAQALSAIKKGIPIPLIADIHFDHRLALEALRAGVDGLRLNPGNIRDPEKVAEVVKAARERKVPIRIGVNFGSLPPDLPEGLSVPRQMVEAAMRHIRILEDLDFDLIKVSLKAFDVPTTIEAYREIAGRIPYPLHIGITESGTPRQGMIRSAVGIGILLWEGLGDTLRVSLTGHPREEVYAGYEILKSLNLREHGAKLVSCPTCGRTEMDIVSLANAVESYLIKVDKPIKVAVMGCVVNGPGEARDADIGVACGRGKAVLFKKGQQIRTIAENDILKELFKEIEQL